MSLCRENDIVIGGSSSLSVGINKTSYGGQSINMGGSWDFTDKTNTTRLSKHDHLFKMAGRRLNIDWRLCAAHCYIESGFNERAKNPKSTAKGLWQFIDGTWKGVAPSGYTDPNNAYNPEIATEAYIRYMSQLLNRYNKADTRNDQIAIAIQCYHDGSLLNGSPLVWSKRWSRRNDIETMQYVPKIMNKYQEFIK